MATLKDFLEVIVEDRKLDQIEEQLLKILKLHLASKRKSTIEPEKEKENTGIDQFGIKKGSKISSLYSVVTKKWKSISQIANEGIVVYGKPYKKIIAIRTCRRCLDVGVEEGWFQKINNGRKSKYRLLSITG